MQPRQLRAIALLMAVIATISINALAVMLPLFGCTPAEISAKYATPMTPATYAFSIWSLIYAGLLAVAFWQARQRYTVGFDRIRGPVLASCAFNAGWIFAFHAEEIGLSVVMIVGLLFALAEIVQRLDRHPRSVPRFVEATFGVYAGWVSMASVANLALWCVYRGIDSHDAGFAMACAIGLMAAGCAIGLWLRSRGRFDIPFVAAALWAFLAVALGNSASPLIASAALLAVVAMALTARIPTRRLLRTVSAR